MYTGEVFLPIVEPTGNCSEIINEMHLVCTVEKSTPSTTVNSVVGEFGVGCTNLKDQLSSSHVRVPGSNLNNLATYRTVQTSRIPKFNLVLPGELRHEPGRGETTGGSHRRQACHRAGAIGGEE